MHRLQTDNPWRFPGQYEDAETGLYYNRFRYYDPELGRYLSEDPIGLLGTLALYSYVYDPATWLDPWGLTFITYLGTDKATGKPYVGYARGPEDMAGRDVLKRRYSNNFKRFTTVPKIVYEGENRDLARGLEQRIFEDYGGLDGTANRQNPVGARNAKRDDYLKAADDHRAPKAKTKTKTKACK